MVVLTCLDSLVKTLDDVVVILILCLDGVNICLQSLLLCDSGIDLLLRLLVDHGLVCVLAQHFAMVFSDCSGLHLLLSESL